jgi:hypothetical protein
MAALASSRQRIQCRLLCGICTGLAAELTFDQLRDAEAAAMRRQTHSELLVGEIAIRLRLLAVQNALAETRAAHGLQHHLREQGFELTRDGRGRALAIRARRRFQACQRAEVGIGAGRARIDRHDFLRSRPARHAARRLP